MVMSITSTRVEMLVNNSAVRSLRAGEVSPEGVKVIEIRAGTALVEIDGRRWQMRIGSATAASVVLQADKRGHFITTATINGQPVPVLIDTGATAVAMNLSEAQRAGVSFAGARREPADQLNELPNTLLGISFLNQVEMQRSGRTLTRRH
jgi:aspartyl protease family protein